MTAASQPDAPQPDALHGDASAPRSRVSLLAEAVLLGGAALAAVVWVIPMQTTDGGVGLSPAVFPTVCAGALGVFAVADAVLRILRGTSEPRYPEGWTAFARIGAVAIVGAVVLANAGIAVCALVTVPAGMAVLGERRPLWIAGAALLSAGLVWLVF
ncbi:MAG: tripartite tricarboxylate transporter TctB family protein [Rhodoplanes sp.]|uniref:tripartite tricarboxylate transporter TctB family protein n=1 Tax=Rhodoplanes sp. TaxID=1968906 RepID=UPI0017FF080D|nr:tripartite tricarboxylate transporter TctB family protein [Rhodoplanes sp.]NVO15420.1 tripartite tricarboxylate transporter TctB family protein [Rhodoplanes sp.]